MVAEQIIFLIAAGVAVGLGVIVVTESNPFRAAVSLIGTLVAVAVIFLLLAAPFVAMLQLIVYAGAIVVLFLFVIAYLGDRRPPDLRDPLVAMEPFAWLSVLAIGALGGVMLAQSRLPGLRDEPAPVDDIGSPEAIGRGFLDDFIVSFEGVSFVLLVAAIGAVLLAKRAVQFEGGR